MPASFDPFRLESAYQHLTSNLQRPASARWKMAQIAGFLHHLPPDHAAVEPYVLGLQPALADVSARFSPIGWPAQPLHALLNRLVQLQRTLPMLGKGWDDAIRHVRRDTAHLYEIL